MDLYEQRLRDEVIYLHSLWHKGPPRRNPISNSRPHFTLHQPLHPPSFKPTFINNGGTVVSPPASVNTTSTVMNMKKRNPKKKKTRIVESGSKTEVELGGGSESCDVQWQSKVTPVEERLDSGSGWPEMMAKAVVPTRVLTGEERTRLVPNQMQCKGLDASRDFFATKECGSGSDEDDDYDDDEDMDDNDDDGDCEKCEEYGFLLNLFTDDSELRSYYEKNYENGEFYCLICGGIGKKVWKKYKDVVAVVQHAIAVSKTAKRRAHRAYAQVICKVLGWDFTRLPTIVLSGNEKLSQSLARLDDSKVDANTIVDTGDKITIKEEDSSKCKVVCKDASKGRETNANSKVGGSKKVDAAELEISVGELMNCSEMLKEFEAETIIQCEQSKIAVEIIDLDGPDEDGANPKT